MTRALSSSVRATSFFLQCQPHPQFRSLTRTVSPRHGLLTCKLQTSARFYADKQFPGKDPDNPHATVAAKETELYGDGINPPLTTLPPPLNLPEKSPDTSTPVYWFRIGRAYGKFYIAGVKQTWANYKKAASLRARIHSSNSGTENDNYPPRRYLGLVPPPLLLDIEVFMRREGLTRSQLQLLVREREDVKKLPLFAILVALFGEWLPLIVPFIPGRVPRTCRIPKQVAGMRKAIEDLRKASFRQGISAPQGGVLYALRERVKNTRRIEEEVNRETKKLKKDDEELEAELGAEEAHDIMSLRLQPANWLAVEMTESLDRDQLKHVSANLGLHGKMLDRITGGDSSLTALLKMRVAKRLHYINLDDELLVKEKTRSFHAMSPQELGIACDERGIDVTNRKEEELRKDLGKWLDGRAKDKGYGEEVLKMLFKR